MAKITAAQVNELRKKTGAGMMDCKKALVESDGDMEKAIDYLRKKGQKVAAKRSDRDANEGVIIAKTNSDNTYGAVVMINCETDFVAKNEDFVNFVTSVADLAIEKMPKTAEELKALDLGGQTVADALIERTGVIGEKIELGNFDVVESAFTAAYIHPGNRLATLVGMNKVAENVEQLGKEIAMQVAAMAPVAVDKEGVSTEIIEREKEIGMEQARAEGKPEAMLEKIAMGKMNKFFKENTLLNQIFVRDGKKTVAEYLKSADAELTVTNFKRFILG
ncbi:MAG: translation elongation factor Ts [Hyphomicrobiales bacterium]